MSSAIRSTSLKFNTLSLIHVQLCSTEHKGFSVFSSFWSPSFLLWKTWQVRHRANKTVLECKIAFVSTTAWTSTTSFFCSFNTIRLSIHSLFKNSALILTALWSTWATFRRHRTNKGSIKFGFLNTLESFWPARSFIAKERAYKWLGYLIFWVGTLCIRRLNVINLW